MNPRERWIEALRSGEYEQATKQLRSNDGFCCLGVACDLFLKENPRVGEWQHNLGMEWTIRVGEFSHSGVLPPEVRQWLGLQTEAGDYTRGVRTHALSYDNDHGASFAKIADIIEAEPEGLVTSDSA